MLTVRNGIPSLWCSETIEEIKAQSAWPIHLVSVENRQYMERDGRQHSGKLEIQTLSRTVAILFSVAALTVGGRTAH